MPQPSKINQVTLTEKVLFPVVFMQLNQRLNSGEKREERECSHRMSNNSSHSASYWGDLRTHSIATWLSWQLQNQAVLYVARLHDSATAVWYRGCYFCIWVEEHRSWKGLKMWMITVRAYSSWLILTLMKHSKVRTVLSRCFFCHKACFNDHLSTLCTVYYQI